jgi:hypothetical protein
MPSFGGYGKALGLYLVAALVPLLGGEFLAFIYIQYFLWFFIGGIVAMLMAMAGILTYSVTSAREIRKIAADMQFPDGTQDFVPILYKEQVKDLGVRAEVLSLTSSLLQQYTKLLPVTEDSAAAPSNPPQGIKTESKTMQLEVIRHRYAVTDLNGNDWLIMLDHPLPQLVPSMDDTPLGALISTVSTQKGTFLPLRYVDEPLSPYDITQPNFLERHILRQEAKTHREVREIYGISTAAKVKAYKDALIKDFKDKQKRLPTLAEEQEIAQKLTAMGYAIIPPSSEEIKSMYDDWVDYRIAGLTNELGQAKDVIAKQNLLLLMKGGTEMTYVPPQPKAEPTDWATVLKVLLIVGAAAGVGFLVWWIFLR